MYEELINSLRNDHDKYFARDMAAADAIEELTALSLRQERQLVELTEQASHKPKWISVEDRLPEEFVNVLCYYEYFRYGDYNCMFRTIDRGYYGYGNWGAAPGQGYESNVLFWMPLPEPPEEVTP